MFKKKQFKPETQIPFKNVPADNRFNPMKTWYGTISTSTGSYLVQYEGIVRSAAVRYFEKQAKELDGKLDPFIGIL